MSSNIKVGTYEGTGAAVNIALGFVPDYMRIWNVEDGDISWEWFNGMTAAYACQTTNHADTQLSVITSNGFTEYVGSSTVAEGMTVGTTLSEPGKTYRYVALANSE